MAVTSCLVGRVIERGHEQSGDFRRWQPEGMRTGRAGRQRVSLSLSLSLYLYMPGSLAAGPSLSHSPGDPELKGSRLLGGLLAG